MLRAAQQKKMHRAEDQIGMRLAGLRARRERLQFLVVADRLRPDANKAGDPVRRRVVGEEFPIIARLSSLIATSRSPLVHHD